MSETWKVAGLIKTIKALARLAADMASVGFASPNFERLGNS